MRTKNGQPLELTLVTYPTLPDFEQIAVALRSQLEEVGITIKIREEESNSVLFDEDFTGWHISLQNTGYAGNNGPIMGIVHAFLTSEGGFNPGGIADPEIDALAEQMDRTFDQEQLDDLFRELQNIMIVEKAYTTVAGVRRRAVVVSDTWADYEVSAPFLFVDWQTAP